MATADSDYSDDITDAEDPADSEYPGVPRALGRRLRQVLGQGLVWTVVAGIYSSGAFLVALVVHPELVPFMAMGATTLVIHVVGTAVRGETGSGSEASRPVAGDWTWLHTTVTYALVATALGALLLWSATVASLVAGVGRPVAAVVVAFGYPLFDRRLRRRARYLSVVGVSTVVVERAAVVLFGLRNVSTESFETAERQARAFY